MAGLDVFPDVERGEFSLAEVTHHGLAKIMNFCRVGGICWAFLFLILTDIIVVNMRFCLKLTGGGVGGSSIMKRNRFVGILTV